jgi:hypothetical protein
MPTSLPAEKWTNDRPLPDSISPSHFSCAAIGAAAVGLAFFIGWAGNDARGAALTLLMTAGLIWLLLHEP